MKIKFPLLASIVLLASGPQAYASLATNAVLLFDDSVYGCADGSTPNPYCSDGSSQVPVGGTFFSFDIDGNGDIELWERTGMQANEGIRLGEAQPAGNSHFGYPDGTEDAGVDQPWHFFGNTGMHQSLSPITVADDDGAGNVLLDMSGWGITWNGIPNVPFGTGSWGSNPESMAMLTCSSDCSVGDTFSLFYTAAVPFDDPSGFGGVRYRLGFDGGLSGSPSAGLSSTLGDVINDSDLGAPVTGIIGAVIPVPAAVWLFASGIISLIGVGRMNRTS